MEGSPVRLQRGVVRDLPSLSLSVYEPLGACFVGEAERFMAGIALGEFVQILSLSGWTLGAGLQFGVGGG